MDYIQEELRRQREALAALLPGVGPRQRGGEHGEAGMAPSLRVPGPGPEAVTAGTGSALEGPWPRYPEAGSALEGPWPRRPEAGVALEGPWPRYPEAGSALEGPRPRRPEAGPALEGPWPRRPEAVPALEGPWPRYPEAEPMAFAAEPRGGAVPGGMGGARPQAEGSGGTAEASPRSAGPAALAGGEGRRDGTLILPEETAPSPPAGGGTAAEIPGSPAARQRAGDDPWERTVTEYVYPAGVGSAGEAEALSRAFQRDARRYDGGFSLY